MCTADTITLVESKDTLSVQSLNALHVVSIDWSSVWLVETYLKLIRFCITDLSRGLHQVCPILWHLHEVVFDLISNLSGVDLILNKAYTLKPLFDHTRLVDLALLNISVNREVRKH